jgi:hypothetical protein
VCTISNLEATTNIKKKTKNGLKWIFFQITINN